MLFRSRFYLSSKTKLTLYYSQIYPYNNYFNSTWSSTYVTNLNRIYCLQKRAVRAITNSDYRAQSAPLFSKLRILDLYQKSTRFKQINLCSAIIRTCCLHCFSTCCLLTVKFIAIAAEELIIIACIIAGFI